MVNMLVLPSPAGGLQNDTGFTRKDCTHRASQTGKGALGPQTEQLKRTPGFLSQNRIESK